MADWFETRFREPVDVGELDPAFVARVRALVVEEWQAEAGTTPRAVTSSDPDHGEGDVIMLEIEDRPEGHAPVPPGRRPWGRWPLVVAAAAVVAVVGTLVVVAGGDDDEPVDAAAPSATTAPAQDVLAVPGVSTGFPPLEPGHYFVDPDGEDFTPLRVSFEVADEGWSAWFGAVKFRARGHTALSITTVANLTTDPCLDHRPLDPPVGPTVDDLATALAQYAPFEVTAPPTDVTLLGYSGKHLELTVPELPVTGPGDEREFSGCLDGNLHSWVAPNNGGAFFGYTGEAGETEEFWILDVEGTRLVLVKNAAPSSPAQDVAELDAIFDSIRIEP